jgi:hypothetical protein
VLAYELASPSRSDDSERGGLPLRLCSSHLHGALITILTEKKYVGIDCYREGNDKQFELGGRHSYVILTHTAPQTLLFVDYAHKARVQTLSP